MSNMQSLNGCWEYRVGKGNYKLQQVPFSKLPVGHSECRKHFDMEYSANKVQLKFDGITYAAKVRLNGTVLGDMLPYSEYTFDITELVVAKNNILEVELEDISPTFGPTAGWENFGGIIRDVSLIYVPENHIQNVFFHHTLFNDYTDADFVVETICSMGARGEFQICLSYNGNAVLTYEQPAGGEFIHQQLTNVHLWSPNEPNLYQLQVSLQQDGHIVDTYSCNVGFREFEQERHRFLLNGQPLFLKGVCKHEMYGTSGHCPTQAQMENDMRMIKDTGCNFVRLVHYPHNKKILDIADKLGLMVSEEPGLWWSDTANPEISRGSLEVLRRTILRDRNHPSIVFWLCFNECIFTEQFLVDSARVCRENDPTRKVSGANCMSDEDTKKFYNICNFDFYTMHPYWPTFERAQKSAKFLNDKPLLFTEWGGHFVYDNPKLLSEFFDDMQKLYLANSDEGSLAGAIFWYWAEVNDFNRGRPACIDGNLCEGLLDTHRNPTLIYDTFCHCIKKIGTNPKTGTEDFWIEMTELELAGKRLLSPPETNRFTACFEEMANLEKSTPKSRGRDLKCGPVLKETHSLWTTPVLVENGTTCVFASGDRTDEILLVGLVSLTKGYPLSGTYGEKVALINLHFEDGTCQEYTLKNGIDVTTVFALNDSSRINPIAEKATRFASFGYDKNFEWYIMNSLKIKAKNDTKLISVSIESSNNGYALLLYGILT